MVSAQIYPTDKSGQIRPLIRTFHGRQGRLSETRLKVLDELVPKYLLSKDQTKKDLSQVFKSDELIVDFGCGMGGHTIDLLEQGKSVLAIDVHTAGICDLAQYADKHQIDRLKLFHGDGVNFLVNNMPEDSISELHIYFPDPWPKARHAKRRLFSADFLKLVHPVIKSGGKILLVTDDDSYAEGAREIVLNQTQYELIELCDPITMTSYHRRAIRLGHNINQLGIRKA